MFSPALRVRGEVSGGETCGARWRGLAGATDPRIWSTVARRSLVDVAEAGERGAAHLPESGKVVEDGLRRIPVSERSALYVLGEAVKSPEALTVLRLGGRAGG